MQRYEYAVVSLMAKLTLGSQVIIYWPDGSETKESKSLTLVLNEMAEQGWEVVTSAGAQGIFHWTLKRERSTAVSRER